VILVFAVSDTARDCHGRWRSLAMTMPGIRASFAFPGHDGSV
jgi:hypothetical protein